MSHQVVVFVAGLVTGVVLGVWRQRRRRRRLTDTEVIEAFRKGRVR